MGCGGGSWQRRLPRTTAESRCAPRCARRVPDFLPRSRSASASPAASPRAPTLRGVGPHDRMPWWGRLRGSGKPPTTRRCNDGRGHKLPSHARPAQMFHEASSWANGRATPRRKRDAKKVRQSQAMWRRGGAVCCVCVFFLHASRAQLSRSPPPRLSPTALRRCRVGLVCALGTLWCACANPEGSRRCLAAAARQPTTRLQQCDLAEHNICPQWARGRPRLPARCRLIQKEHKVSQHRAGS